MIFLVVILAHLIADFYLQTDKMVEDKSKYLKLHLLHHFVVTGIFLTIYSFIGDSFRPSLFQVGFITVSTLFFHFLIDLLKIKLSKKKQGITKHSSYPLILFVGDQVLHILSILVVCSFFYKLSLLDLASQVLTFLNIGTGEAPALSTIHILIFLVIMFIIATTVSGHVIKHVIGILPQHLSLYEGKYVLKDILQGSKAGKGAKQPNLSEEYSYMVVKKQDLSRGKIIGYIERLLVIILTVEAAYPAIGFIVAAKSLARFKQMDDRDFAEYFLLGTLSSMFLGVIYGLIIKLVLY